MLPGLAAQHEAGVPLKELARDIRRELGRVLGEIAFFYFGIEAHRDHRDQLAIDDLDAFLGRAAEEEVLIAEVGDQSDERVSLFFQRERLDMRCAGCPVATPPMVWPQ